uniref:Uncharacterized protein n=1 Tax=Arundo donax TaxID=35708 RepID=A0A0A9E5E0_ARUDO
MSLVRSGSCFTVISSLGMLILQLSAFATSKYALHSLTVSSRKTGAALAISGAAL